LTCQNVEAWSLDSIEVSDTKRKSKHKFALAQPIDSATTVVDLFPEGCMFSNNERFVIKKINVFLI